MISDRHRADLEASGLSAETIRDSGIYSASAAEVEAILGYGAGRGMVIPYDRAGENGTPQYARVKIDHPGPDGKRYRSPKGRGNRLYIPFTIDPRALVDVPIDDLHVLPWLGRAAVIVFDSDAATNDDVRRAEQALAAELRQRGALVSIKRLPELAA